MKSIRFEMNDGTEVFFPAVKAVCYNCNGEGSVLCDGLRGQVMDFEEWEQEEVDGYFNGNYDVSCPVCKGNNVVSEIDRSACSSVLLTAALAEYDANLSAEYDYQREVAAERAFGC